MFKTFTAGLLAVSLTFTSATSTQANGLSEDDIGKLLFGLVATAAIASAIKNNRDDDRARVTIQQKPRVHVQRQHQPRAHAPRQHQPRGHVRGNHRRAVPAPLPLACMREVQTRNGIRRIFGQRCLNNNYAQAHRLPRECAVRFNTNRGQRTGYAARCLRNNGYSARR